MEKYRNFQVGQKGVNLNASPLHLSPDELTIAQNVFVDKESAEGGLGKRPGMTRLNSAAALAGAVAGGLDVNLPAVPPDALYAALEVPTAGANLWRKSIDNGLTWSTVTTTPAKAAQSLKLGATMAAKSPSQRMVTYNGRLYYAADGYTQYPTTGHTAPTIRVFDGVSDSQVCAIPPQSETPTPSATDTVADTVDVSTTAGPGWATGVMVTPNATVGGLIFGQTYYLRAVDADTFSFHTTLADAQANTNKVNLTAAITAVLTVVGNASFNSAAILSLIVANGFLYCSTWDDITITGTNAPGRVFEIEPATGTISQIGRSFGAAGEAAGIPWCLCFAEYDQIVVGTHNGLGGAADAAVGQVMRHTINATISAWTAEYSSPAGGGNVLSLCMYRGFLYASFQADTAIAPTVRVRTGSSTAPAWVSSDARPVAGASGYDYIDGLIVYKDELYAVYFNRNTPNFSIRKFDGTNWLTDYNIQANYPGRTTLGQTFVFNDALYVVLAQPNTTGATPGSTTGLILRKPSAAGAWVKVDDNWFRGYIGAVSPPE